MDRETPPDQEEAGAASSAGGRATYADPGEIAGRSPAEFVYWVVLAITACADVAIFHLILSLLMTRSEAWVVWLAVAGFTACSLLLSHLAGRIAKDTRTGHGQREGTVVGLLAATWLLLGGAAFLVRIIVAEPNTATATAVGTQDAETQAWAGAALFLVLYLGSGLVSGIGAYVSRNPLRDRYHKARRDHRAAQKRLRHSQAPYERALSVLQVHQRNRHREQANYDAARALRHSWVEDMKQYTRIVIAAELQDPSATTGLTTTRPRVVRRRAGGNAA